jgi:hypothetical protein
MREISGGQVDRFKISRRKVRESEIGVAQACCV